MALWIDNSMNQRIAINGSDILNVWLSKIYCEAYKNNVYHFALIEHLFYIKVLPFNRACKIYAKATICHFISNISSMVKPYTR